jgi:hypothetical protein
MCAVYVAAAPGIVRVGAARDPQSAIKNLRYRHRSDLELAGFFWCDDAAIAGRVAEAMAARSAAGRSVGATRTRCDFCEEWVAFNPRRKRS